MSQCIKFGISLPVEQFQALDYIATQFGKSRSEILSQVLGPALSGMVRVTKVYERGGGVAEVLATARPMYEAAANELDDVFTEHLGDRANDGP